MQRPHGGTVRLPFDIGRVRSALVMAGQLDVRAPMSVHPHNDRRTYSIQSRQMQWIVREASNIAARDDLIVDGHIVRAATNR
ncbi:hypothetical protein [Rhodococcus sp. 077-4]|uniref:hypothetical protein n=1 Tax=Rhodococcus sp. 077-4 TaxID=2789271 RepID=UPI0039F5D18C